VDAQRLSLCVVCLVLSSFQGSAPLKPADVVAMVNHRDKVVYVNVIVVHDGDEEACLQRASFIFDIL